jgi:methylornithine synthase
MPLEKVALNIESTLSKACSGNELDPEEIRHLLGLTDPEEIEWLFSVARYMRKLHSGDRVFLYAFLYFSTFCKNDCAFCKYRKSNTHLVRYRKDRGEIVETACRMADSGMHMIDLTMGEDPAYFHADVGGAEALEELVRDVKKATSLPIMISPGVVSEGSLRKLMTAGADWYACYQETHNTGLFRRLRCGQEYNDRFSAKASAKKFGLLIEEGLLRGVGESIDDVADSITSMRRMDADQVRVMTFVPQAGTPMAHLKRSDSIQELITIAVLRLVFPGRLVPASLDVDGLAGLKERLNAGANVVTSLVPPGTGLAGVANSQLDIEESRRTADAILPILAQCGLRVGSDRDYRSYMNRRRFNVISDSLLEKSA